MAEQRRPTRRRLPRLPRGRPKAIYINQHHRFAMLDLAWLHSGLSPTAIRVLAVLTSHADSDSGYCFPSKEKIGVEARIRDLTQIRKAFIELESAGAIEREIRSGMTSRYWLRPPKRCDAVLRNQPADSHTVGESRPGNVSNSHPERVGESHPGSDDPRAPGETNPPEESTLSNHLYYGIEEESI